MTTWVISKKKNVGNYSPSFWGSFPMSSPYTPGVTNKSLAGKSTIFDGYLLGKMGIFMGELLVTGRVSKKKNYPPGN